MESNKKCAEHRAFESLNKEIEYQELEIQLAEQINQLKELIEKKNEELARAEENSAKERITLNIKKKS